MDFNYDVAFSRNIGWVTHDEQTSLRNKRVAIAGCGGVGGLHSLTLARLGVGKLNISDFDQFDIHNMNRQSGAFVSTRDQDKIEVMSRMLLDINPELDIREFPKGIERGHLHVDIGQLPTKLYKFNGRKWIEVDKTISDGYTHNAAYIEYLIDQLNTGPLTPDDLTETEQEMVRNQLKNSVLTLRYPVVLPAY